MNCTAGYTRIARVHLNYLPQTDQAAAAAGEKAQSDAFKQGYHRVEVKYGEPGSLTLDLLMRNWVVAAGQIPGQMKRR